MTGHAVVTGAASGIGRAIALRLLSADWQVTTVDLREPGIEGAPAITGDLAGSDFPADVIRRAWSAAPVDALVNAAGIYPAIPFFELTAALWDRVQQVNLRAPVLATQELARLAVAEGRAPSVVNIASGAGRRPRPGAAHYSVSKAGLVMATRACAIELGRYGIRVNAVSPGFIDVASDVNPVTPEYAAVVRQSALPGSGTADDIADAVSYLLSPGARWVTGSVLTVDGGTSAGAIHLPPHWSGPTPGQLGF
jgi:3-oxoacyl-[acyl-carrier protein] reductase